jgi:hypothetical protein
MNPFWQPHSTPQCDKSKGKLFNVITASLIFAVMLCLEVSAHAYGWHFTVSHWPPFGITHAVLICLYAKVQKSGRV